MRVSLQNMTYEMRHEKKFENMRTLLHNILTHLPGNVRVTKTVSHSIES